MDREDLGVALLPALAAGGRDAACTAWRTFLDAEAAS
jgi:hypothetical protein